MKVKNTPTVYFLMGLLCIAISYTVDQLVIIKFPFNLSGMVIIWMGVSLNGKAKDLYNIYETPQSFRPTTFLITEGVYSQSRHPMYLGMCFIQLGFSMCFGNIGAFLFPLGLFLLLHFYFIPIEEKTLEQKFGDTYTEYKRKVHKWM